jgi:hypothetical protein
MAAWPGPAAKFSEMWINSISIVKTKKTATTFLQVSAVSINKTIS